MKPYRPGDFNKNRANSFGTFLERVQHQHNLPSSPFKIVTTLSLTGPTKVSDLMTESGLLFNDFAEGIRILEKAGYVVMNDISGNEMVALTPIGEQLARAQNGTM